MTPHEPLVPPWARDAVRRLAELQRAMNEGGQDVDPVAIFVEHCALYRSLREGGLTELQIESAIHHLLAPN